MIHEVQYATALFRHIKVEVDQRRHDTGRFILTGSQKFPLMREVSDSLAGRAAWFELEGLSAQELARGAGSTCSKRASSLACCCASCGQDLKVRTI